MELIVTGEEFCVMIKNQAKTGYEDPLWKRIREVGEYRIIGDVDLLGLEDVEDASGWLCFSEEGVSGIKWHGLEGNLILKKASLRGIDFGIDGSAITGSVDLSGVSVGQIFGHIEVGGLLNLRNLQIDFDDGSKDAISLEKLPIRVIGLSFTSTGLDIRGAKFGSLGGRFAHVEAVGDVWLDDETDREIFTLFLESGQINGRVHCHDNVWAAVELASREEPLPGGISLSPLGYDKLKKIVGEFVPKGTNLFLRHDIIGA